MKIRLDGIEEMEGELNRLNSIRWDAVRKKQAVQILNRARQPGGTPVDTGELRTSSSSSGEEVGYTKDYAPHVEFGHRTRSGSFVPGQRFLKRNVDTQKEIYKHDLKRAIEKEGG